MSLKSSRARTMPGTRSTRRRGDFPRSRTKSPKRARGRSKEWNRHVATLDMAILGLALEDRADLH